MTSFGVHPQPGGPLARRGPVSRHYRTRTGGTKAMRAIDTIFSEFKEPNPSPNRIILEGILRLQERGRTLREIGEQLALYPERVHTLVIAWLERKL